MTQITHDTVQHLAQLSSLMLADSEIDGLAKDLEEILGYVELLNELDIDDVEPTYQVTDLENVWREDTVCDDGISGAQLVELAADQKDSQVKVPKVLSW